MVEIKEENPDMVPHPLEEQKGAGKALEKEEEEKVAPRAPPPA